MQVEYDKLFSILRTEKKIDVIINSFINAYLNDAMEQLEGQIAFSKIAMLRLSSPQLYYVLSGNDFTQLKKDYGKDQADVIMNITGNIISGKVTGETARQLSERFGKIMQERS